MDRRSDDGSTGVRTELPPPLPSAAALAGRDKKPTDADYYPPSWKEPALLRPGASSPGERSRSAQKQLARILGPGAAGPLPRNATELQKQAQAFILQSAESHGLVGGERVPQPASDLRAPAAHDDPGDAAAHALLLLNECRAESAPFSTGGMVRPAARALARLGLLEGHPAWLAGLAAVQPADAVRRRRRQRQQPGWGGRFAARLRAEEAALSRFLRRTLECLASRPEVALTRSASRQVLPASGQALEILRYRVRYGHPRATAGTQVWALELSGRGDGPLAARLVERFARGRYVSPRYGLHLIAIALRRQASAGVRRPGVPEAGAALEEGAAAGAADIIRSARPRASRKIPSGAVRRAADAASGDAASGGADAEHDGAASGGLDSLVAV